MTAQNGARLVVQPHAQPVSGWLSKRMGKPMRAPRLRSLRYALEGAAFAWRIWPCRYALSAQTGRAELARVSAEVYRQLERK